MLRQLAALAVATTLLVTAAPVAQSAAAAATSCTRIALDLPPGSLPVAGATARSADPSGHYILGEAHREDIGSQPVLWVDGVPRWLGSRPGVFSQAYAVVEGGYVLGQTSTQETTDYWIYSAKDDSYRPVKFPKGLRIYALVGMNSRLDIIGMTANENQEMESSFVWQSGRKVRMLAVPKGVRGAYVTDIADDGRIVGAFVRPGESILKSYLWRSWNARPALLEGLHQKDVWARDIEGPWVGGDEATSYRPAGLIWNTATGRVVELPDSVADLNSSGDAVTVGDHFIDQIPSTLVRSNGTKITFPEGTMLNHIFDRGARWTATGYDVGSGMWQPIVYKCDG